MLRLHHDTETPDKMQHNELLNYMKNVKKYVKKKFGGKIFHKKCRNENIKLNEGMIKSNKYI